MKNLLGFLLSDDSIVDFIFKPLYRLSNLFFLSLILSCAPERTTVTDLDIHKVIDRISYSRFSDRLESEDPVKLKSDREIFLETCELYRLNPDLVLEKLQVSHPNLFIRLKENHEK
jgi:hypothetical protein